MKLKEIFQLPAWQTLRDMGQMIGRDITYAEMLERDIAHAAWLLTGSEEIADACRSVIEVLAQPPIRSLGGLPASMADEAQVEHARWAVEADKQGKFTGKPEHLADYKAIAAAADAKRMPWSDPRMKESFFGRVSDDEEVEGPQVEGPQAVMKQLQDIEPDLMAWARTLRDSEINEQYHGVIACRVLTRLRCFRQDEKLRPVYHRTELGQMVLEAFAAADVPNAIDWDAKVLADIEQLIHQGQVIEACKRYRLSGRALTHVQAFEACKAFEKYGKWPTT